MLTFPFTIRNQVVVSFTTLRGAAALRPQLVQYQREFYQTAANEAAQQSEQAYVFGSADDPARTYHMAEVLRPAPDPALPSGGNHHHRRTYLYARRQLPGSPAAAAVPTHPGPVRAAHHLHRQPVLRCVGLGRFRWPTTCPSPALAARQFSQGEAVDTLTFPRGQRGGGPE